MEAIFAILIVVGVVGSPVWVSLVIWTVPRRWWPVDFLLLGFQALVAYLPWWFFWGGGIGGEFRLSPMWQWLGALAFLPIVVVSLKHSMSHRA
jgi:hypothetical protein